MRCLEEEDPPRAKLVQERLLAQEDKAGLAGAPKGVSCQIFLKVLNDYKHGIDSTEVTHIEVAAINFAAAVC